MIAVDTSVLIDYSRGTSTRGASIFEKCLLEGTIVLPEPVLFEVVSGPTITSEVESAFLALPRLIALAGYWERAGILRRKLLKKRVRARAMDCLVAQICIDHRVPLITSDKDFKKFEAFDLKLV